MDAAAEPVSPSPDESNRDILSELTDDGPVQADASSGEPAPASAAEPVAAAEPSQGASAAPKPGASAAPVAPTTPQPPRLKYQGREISPEDIAKDPKLFERLVQSAEQLPHLQRIREQERQAAEQRAAQPTAPQPPSVEQIRQYQARLRAEYEPRMKQLVDAGVLSQSAVEWFPDELANMLALGDSHAALRNELNEIKQVVQGGSRQARQQGFLQFVADSLDALSQEGDDFKALTDGEVKNAFWQHIYRLNPDVRLVTPDFLRQQWLAFNYDTISTALRTTREAQAAQAARAKVAGSPATQGVRPNPALPPPSGGLNDLFDE